jgi:type II secretory pathway pseudopilin PulG
MSKISSIVVAVVGLLFSTAGGSNLRSVDGNKLKALESIASVIEKELTIVEKYNRPNLLSSSIERFYSEKFQSISNDKEHPVHQRFESAVTVPDACTSDCKTAWNKLGELFGKYFECQPKCDEAFMQEKTAGSEAVDEKCMSEQKCWEAIEAVIFTKPKGGNGEDSGKNIGGSMAAMASTGAQLATDVAKQNGVSDEAVNAGKAALDKVGDGLQKGGVEGAKDAAKEMGNEVAKLGTDKIKENGISDEVIAAGSAAAGAVTGATIANKNSKGEENVKKEGESTETLTSERGDDEKKEGESVETPSPDNVSPDNVSPDNVDDEKKEGESTETPTPSPDNIDDEKKEGEYTANSETTDDGADCQTKEDCKDDQVCTIGESKRKLLFLLNWYFIFLCDLIYPTPI